MYTVVLTSTANHTREFCYRMPNKQVLSVVLPEYALNHSVDFPSEDIYTNCFKKQNAKYFAGDHPILIEGKTSAGKAEKINEATEKKRAKKITDSAVKATEEVANATQGSGVTVSVDVDKVAE